VIDMVKIKGWKKVGVYHWKKSIKYGIEEIWIAKDIQHIRTDRFGKVIYLPRNWIVQFKREELGKPMKFKNLYIGSKSQSIKFAKNYMKKHPRG